MFMPTHLDATAGTPLWSRPMSIVLRLEHALVQRLAQDYRRRSLTRAAAAAYADFAPHYPQWAAARFDRHFVRHHLLPMLAAAEAGVPVTPQQIAAHYAAQFNLPPAARVRLCAEVMPAAAHFLQRVAAVLEDAR